MNVWRKCEEPNATDNSYGGGGGGEEPWVPEPEEEVEFEDILDEDHDLPERTEDEMYALLKCPVV